MIWEGKWKCFIVSSVTLASKIQKVSISLSSKVLWSSVFLGLVQTTSIPLKNLELVVSLPWTSHSSPRLEIQMGGTILPPEYFTLGRSMADSLTGMFLSFNVGHFTWAPFSIYEVVTYSTHCCFYSISSAKYGTVIQLWFGPQSLVCMNRLHHE
jgi:hypothetical protein